MFDLSNPSLNISEYFTRECTVSKHVSQYH